MRAIVRLSVAVLALLFAAGIAQADQQKQPSSIGAFGEAGLISTTLNTGAAHEQGVGSWGAGLLMGGGMHVRTFFLAGMQIEGQIMGDRDPFENSTTLGVKKSSVAFYDFSLFAGLQTPPLRVAPHRHMRFSLNVGHSWASAKRGINDCVDCDSESMRFQGGAYLEPGILVEQLRGGNRSTGVNVSLRLYEKKSDMRFTILVLLRQTF